MSNLIRKFIKSPDLVEAFEWTGKSETLRDPEISMFMANNPHFTGELGVIYIHTLDGGVREAMPGDYIVKSIRGDIYPVSKKEFGETYKEYGVIEIREARPEDYSLESISPKKEFSKECIIPSVTAIDMETMNPVEISQEPSTKTNPQKTKKVVKAGSSKYDVDLKGLEDGLGIKLDEMQDLVLEIPLQELNKYCPRDFVKAKSYMGLIGHLKKVYGVDLKITSQRSK